MLRLGNPADKLRMLDLLIRVATHHQDEGRRQEFEAQRQKMLEEKADNLPPTQKVAHLQKRHRLAMEELRKLLRAQEAVDLEYDQLRRRRTELHERVEDQRDMAERLRDAVEQAEMEIPPKQEPRPVGKQLHHSDPTSGKELLKKLSVDDLLEEVTDKIRQASGGQDLTDRMTEQGANLLSAAFASAIQEREDRRAAERLDRELNGQGLQSGDKRAREVRQDRAGDECMMEHADLPIDDDEANPQPWQVAGRKKGKGRLGPAKGPQAAAASSSTGQPSSTSQADRDRSPRRPTARGTPGVAAASGTLLSSGVDPTQVEDAETPTLPVQAMPSATVQPAVEEEETPYMAPQGAGANEADDETPSIDSLATTPRAQTQDEPETPFLCGQMDVEEDAALQNAYMAEANASAIRAGEGDTGDQPSLNPGGRPPLV